MRKGGDFGEERGINSSVDTAAPPSLFFLLRLRKQRRKEEMKD